MSYETIGDDPDLYDLYEGTQVYVTGVGTRYNIFICDTNPASNAFVLDEAKFVFYIDDYDFADTNPRYKIAIFDKIATDTWNILSSEASWRTVPRPTGGSGSVYAELSSVGLPISSGDYIGVIIEVDNPSSGTDLCTIGVRGDSDTSSIGRRYSSTSIPSSNFTTSADDYISIFGSRLITGGGIGGPIKYSCHSDTGVWSDEEVVDEGNTWGYIRPTDFDLVGTHKVYCTVTPPWDTEGTYTNDVVFTDDVAKTIDNEDDEHEHWKLTFDVSTIDGGSIIEYTECWWRDNETGDVYVAEDGSDSNWGSNWSNPFGSIEKGFEEVSDGRNIYVESGLYSETLANLDINSTNNSCKLVPVHKDHVISNYANVVVGTGTKGKVEVVDSPSVGYAITTVNATFQWVTIFNNDISYPVKNVQLFKYIHYITSGSSTTDVRLVHLRPNGLYYDLIDKSDIVRISASWPSFVVEDIYAGFNLQSGDIIAIEIHFIGGDTNGVAGNSNLGTSKYIRQEITGNTLKSDWTITASGLILEMRYFD